MKVENHIMFNIVTAVLNWPDETDEEIILFL